jgi:hypothetical protein
MKRNSGGGAFKYNILEIFYHCKYHNVIPLDTIKNKNKLCLMMFNDGSSRPPKKS